MVWIHPFPASSIEEILAGDPVLWGSVVRVADTYFSLAASQGSTPGCGGTIERIVFPITLHARAAIR